MKISIIVPTYNNFNYLKFFITSLKNNSHYDHEIIVHINDGSDGTLDYVKQNKILYTYSKDNIGLCDSVNNASLLSTTNFILYAHDDMYFCKNWDLYLENEVKKYKNNFYYISGTNISYKDGSINYDCGSSPKNFNFDKFNAFCSNDTSNDLQGSHWAPHLIHKDIWVKVGGFSTEFNPGDGSDPDLCMKLWKENIRIFKCLSKFKVYHFGSVTTRKKDKFIKNNGTKTFVLKWGITPRTFRKHYLKGEIKIEYNEPLKDPELKFNFLKDLFIDKLKFIYFKILTNFKTQS